MICEPTRRFAGSESAPAIGSGAMGPPPPPIRFMICRPIPSKRSSTRLRASSSVSPFFGVTWNGCGPIAAAPTIPAVCAVTDITSPPTPVEFSL